MSTGDADPLLVALLERLPAPGSTWSLAERALWLRAFEAAVHVVYKPAISNTAGIGRGSSPRVRELIETHGGWILAALNRIRQAEHLEASTK